MIMSKDSAFEVMLMSDDEAMRKLGSILSGDNADTQPDEPQPLPIPGRWAIIEFMGHRRYVGAVSRIDDELTGLPMIRVAVPQDAAMACWKNHVHAPSTVYAYRYVTEHEAMAELFPISRPLLPEFGEAEEIEDSDDADSEAWGGAADGW